MSNRIAIPEPTSFDPVYNQRSFPQYLAALQAAGAIPVPISLDLSQHQVANLLATTSGILLPGSGADIDPQKYGEPRNPNSADPDPARSAVDELLIQDAFNLHKPILGICYGTQAINVWCGGDMLQDIPSQTASPVNHAPGRQILEAHPIQVTPDTRLAAILSTLSPGPGSQTLQAQVNSSHHQAIRTPGDNLIVSALSPQDNIIEAVELPGAGPDSHFVLAVQWHPERTYTTSPLSQAIFQAFLEATKSWRPRKVQESVLQS